MAIKEIGGTQYYMIHYRRRKKTTDIRIPIGEENGRMFNGTLKEYGDKFNVEISSDAWEAEKKDKRKAVDDLETSLEKKGELWRRIHMSYTRGRSRAPEEKPALGNSIGTLQDLLDGLVIGREAVGLSIQPLMKLMVITKNFR
ncbi:Protein CBG17135 [Caenorhabditis briggsae]|uniref:Protein CBG17135 n=1 Tax=Caenorhabditis briggsae TaxID=6238 RepID=A8XQP7_CAEBR|nr:Protein CBG17135 [Caenorhabditis briggsae]CAP34972.1 Protein CBG17135 [Caenorhabditis briggsae]